MTEADQKSNRLDRSPIRHLIHRFKTGKIRKQVDDQFSWWGDFSYRHAWLIILLMSGLVGLLGWQVQYIKIETSTEGFLKETHPARIAYSEFRHQFGRDEKMVITLAPKELFSLEFLNTLKQLHQELENAPHAKEVTSLINARQTFGEGDQLIVGELLETFPQTEEELQQLRQKVMSNPLYRGMLISEDGSKTTIAITTETYSSIAADNEDVLSGFDDEFDTLSMENAGTLAESEQAQPFLSGDENSEFIMAVEKIIERYDTPEIEIHFAGSPSMTHRIMVLMAADMAKFTGLSILCIAFFLAILFRRISTIFLPLTIALLSLICTLGVMTLINIAITPIGQSMPSFLLAVGVGNSVHLLAIFFQGIQKGMDKREALIYALGHSGLPVVMTGLTTAGGIISFTTAEVAYVADFGIITTIGVLNALIFSLVLLPALIAVFPVKLKLDTDKQNDKQDWSKSFLLWCGNFSTTHARKVVALYAVIIIASLYSASNITFSHDPIRWFKADDPMLIGTEYVDKHFSGAMYLETIVNTKKEDGIKDPDLLNRLEQMHQAAAELKVGEVQATKSYSINNIIKEINKALNENNPDYYAIPQDPALIAQELLLFENSGADDLEDFTDSQFSKARFTMILPARDSVVYEPYFNQLKNRFSEIMGDKAEVSYAGIMTMMTGALIVLMNSLAKTYLLALMIITPLMMLLIGSVRAGLISMIPNLTPIIITLGIMGWIGFPMDAFTLLTGSIALGLAVDDTIHFMHNFRRYYQQCGDTKEAVRKTLATTGQALFITSAVLASGFFIYMFSSMVNLINFGILTGFTIIMALLADIILAPALMVVLERFMNASYQTNVGEVAAVEQAGDERRTSVRKHLQDLAGVINVDGTVYDCVIVNTSDGIGVKVNKPLTASIGKHVEIKSTTTGTVRGKIAWISGQNFGLEVAA